MKEIEERLAKERMSEGGQYGIKNKDKENLPDLKKGKSRDIAAQKVGCSGKAGQRED